MHQTGNISISFIIWSDIQRKSWHLLRCILEWKSLVWKVRFKWYTHIEIIIRFRMVKITDDFYCSDMACSHGPDTFHKKYSDSWKNYCSIIFPCIYWRICCYSITTCTGAMKNMVQIPKLYHYHFIINKLLLHFLYVFIRSISCTKIRSHSK